MALVLGADGCRGGGWVVASVPLTGTGLSWHYADDTRALLDLARSLGAVRVAVDVPIGLAGSGTRDADVQARARLGRPASSSVFAAPHRSVLDLVDGTYADARPHHPSLSAQAFALVRRIKDVDDALRGAGPGVHDVVAECHPEVCFRELTGRVLPSKKSAPGALARLDALEASLGPLARDVDPRAVLDDALDAAACAWTARRWAAGTAEVLGGALDATGVPMRIVV